MTIFYHIFQLVYKKGVFLPRKKLNVEKEAYKLLYKYERYKDDNVSGRYNKRETITDFLNTL